MIALLQTITRLLAFISKEFIEVTRRPGAIISLILGPFLIMSVFEVHINVTDPIQQAYAGVLAARLASEVNAQIIKQAASQGEQYALAAGQQSVTIPPYVIASPTRAEVTNEAPIAPAVLSFY